MPPKFKSIKITLPVFTGPVSYAMETLVKQDFSKDRATNVIDRAIGESKLDLTKEFLTTVKKYIQTAEITIEK